MQLQTIIAKVAVSNGKGYTHDDIYAFQDKSTQHAQKEFAAALKRTQEQLNFKDMEGPSSKFTYGGMEWSIWQFHGKGRRELPTFLTTDQWSDELAKSIV